jgi:hypothetical protein
MNRKWWKGGGRKKSGVDERIVIVKRCMERGNLDFKFDLDSLMATETKNLH